MKKVMIFNGAYLPGYKAGGPIRSIKNLVDLTGKNFEYYVVTKDRDLGDLKKYDNIESNQWVTLDNERVYYQKYKETSILKLHKIIIEIKPDVLLLNAIFSPYTYKVFLLKSFGYLKNIRVICMPRGTLSSGALSLKKSKKKYYLFFTKLFRCYRKMEFVSTSTEETNEIHTVLNIPHERIKQLTNLPTSIRKTNKYKEKSQNDLNIVFLSRISKKKNLEYCLSIMKEIDLDINFDIYGPIEDEKYWKEIKLIINELNIESKITVTYKGSVNNSKLDIAYRDSHLFFLPTLGENYGHVIVEALQYDLPVLLSDKTPWSTVSKYKCGRTISLSKKDQYIKYIRELYSMNQEEYNQITNNVREFVNTHLNPDIHANEYIKYLGK